MAVDGWDDRVKGWNPQNVDAGPRKRGRIDMPPTLQELGIDRLSAEDRLALAEALWESVARESDTQPLSEDQRRELERRLADSIAHPDAVTPWEVVKARALARARQ
jgi:putative addiction module component (TIGR02574 family)